MNAIIALCHFCDYHGPRTLFCTQVFKYADFQQQQKLSTLSSNSTYNTESSRNVTKCCNDSASSTATNKVEFVLQPAPPDLSSPNFSSINAFNLEQHIQQQQANISTSPSSNSSHSLSPKMSGDRSGNHQEPITSTCKACRAFDKTFHYYISYDDAVTSNSINNNNNKTSNINNTTSTTSESSSSISSTNICYLSQSTPSDSEVFALVRKACLRTLHCEVFEDPIYFDDDKNGSVIGYEFNIKDSEGRGLQRSYSLIIIMKDRIYLQHLWSFLSKQMAIIASNIKAEAERKFNKDMSERENQTSSPTSTADSSSTNVNAYGEPASDQSAGGGIPLSSFYSSTSSYQRQTAMFIKKKASKQVRGLIELTDDPMIFAKLHMWFTWLLRMSSCQISEEYMHGPVSEDVQVRLERDQLREQFKMFKTSKAATASSNIQFLDSSADGLTKRGNEADDSFCEDVQFHLEKCSSGGVDDGKIRKPLAEETEAKSDDKFGREFNNYLLSTFKIESLRNLIQLVGVDAFHQLAYHTIVGNQVIIRGKYEWLVSSIIRELESLVPVGCCKSIYFSDKYVKSYECKLLGISDKALVLFKDNLDLLYLSNSSGNEGFITNSLYPDLNEHILLDISISPNCGSAEIDFDYSDSDSDRHKNFEQILAIIKEMNEINVFIRSNVEQITQVPTILKKIESHLLNENLDQESVNFLIKMHKDEWINKAKVFFKYMQSPNVKNKVESDVVLKMQNLSKDDELTIKYWQAGLSHECKAQIRSS